MPSFQKFLAGLMLFSPAVYCLANYEQAQAGKVKGFTGPVDVELTYVFSVSQGSVNLLGHTVLTPNFS